MSDDNDKILYTKKTITQDPDDPDLKWIELELYNFAEDQDYKDKTVH